MKLHDLYTDWRVVGGLALAILGAGNWIIGLERTQQYSQIIASDPNGAAGSDYRSFDELDASAGGAVLEPLTARERAVSYATARMDFYHATFLTGQMLVLVALIIAFWGVIAVIQNDARRAMHGTIVGGPGPPAAGTMRRLR
ncbi:MAG: hypothetical protein WA740_15330 [Candidatus Binataceae bacterium]